MKNVQNYRVIIVLMIITLLFTAGCTKKAGNGEENRVGNIANLEHDPSGIGEPQSTPETTPADGSSLPQATPTGTVEIAGELLPTMAKEPTVSRNPESTGAPEASKAPDPTGTTPGTTTGDPEGATTAPPAAEPTRAPATTPNPTNPTEAEPEFLQVLKLLPAGTRIDTSGSSKEDLDCCFYTEALTEAAKTQLTGQCSITKATVEQLCLLRVLYYDTGGSCYIGAAVTPQAEAEALLSVYRSLFQNKTGFAGMEQSGSREALTREHFRLEVLTLADESVSYIHK